VALNLNNAPALMAAGLTPNAIAALALADGIDPGVISGALGAQALKEALEQERAKRAEISKAVRAEIRACKASEDPGRDLYTRMIEAGYKAIVAKYTAIANSGEPNPYGGPWPSTINQWALGIKRYNRKLNKAMSTGSLGINVDTDPYSTITRKDGTTVAGPVFLGLRWDGRQPSRKGASGAKHPAGADQPVATEITVAPATEVQPPVATVASAGEE